MMAVDEGRPVVAPDGVAEDDRVAAIGRLHELVGSDGISLERFSVVLEQVFAAQSHGDLVAAMSVLPPLVRLTPSSQRLAKPLVLHTADSGLRLGSGWQLASHTAISTGVGAARLDLTAATWDSHEINLHLETWGSIEVLIPEGVAVQVLGASGRVQLEALTRSVPGGPELRISTSGPTGVIRIRHPRGRRDRAFRRWKRRRTDRGRRR